jgi:hypothetical protein
VDSEAVGLRFLKVEVESDMAEDGLRAVADEGAPEQKKSSLPEKETWQVTVSSEFRPTSVLDGQSSTPASLWFLAHRSREFEVEGTPYNC